MTRIHFNEVALLTVSRSSPTSSPPTPRSTLRCAQRLRLRQISDVFHVFKAIRCRDADEVMGRIRRAPVSIHRAGATCAGRNAPWSPRRRAEPPGHVIREPTTWQPACPHGAQLPRWAGGAPCRRRPSSMSLSCAFGCRWSDVPQVVCWTGQPNADLGVRGLTICDTTGMAHRPRSAAWWTHCGNASLRADAALTTRAAWGW
jgi:hydroxymethylglutaryl-CoA lyase